MSYSQNDLQPGDLQPGGCPAMPVVDNYKEVVEEARKIYREWEEINQALVGFKRALDVNPPLVIVSCVTGTEVALQNARAKSVLWEGIQELEKRKSKVGATLYKIQECLAAYKNFGTRMKQNKPQFLGHPP